VFLLRTAVLLESPVLFNLCFIVTLYVVIYLCLCLKAG